MNKTTLKVPFGVKYLSEWTDYDLPKGHCIVDKGVTGCGYTEYALCNNHNVVLCSPRKLLLENKRDQHVGDLNILYLENKVDGFSGVKNLEDKIRDHIFNCQGPYGGKPVKFLVTYDSAHYIAKVLYEMGILEDFIFVVDEMQSVFLDSYFKSSVELDFVETLQICPNVLYLSATPMLDKYLEKIPEFKDLDFYSLDWSETGYVERVLIERKQTKSLHSECGSIIEAYLDGNFPLTLDDSGKPTKSTEAVFYFNSVTEITRLVKKYGLTPKNTLIICSDTEDNKAKLKKIGFQVGKVPLKGQGNPMFIFCTSAIYMGIDFYSPCAKSFVFADPNIDSLALDISLDLPQIVGRQRDRSNPFKNILTLFYKTKRKGETQLTRENFDNLQAQRRESTKTLLDFYQKGTPEERAAYVQKLKRDSELYMHDFVSISKNTNLPMYNSLIDISNERAWEVSQKDYQDKISVTKALQSQGFETGEAKNELDLILSDFLDNHFFTTGLFPEKLKMYCEFMDTFKDNVYITESVTFKIGDSRYRDYYNFYGTSGCYAKGYRDSSLKLGMGDSSEDDRLKAAICIEFKSGDRYTSKELKIKLGAIYKKLGITRTPKAIDLGKYISVVKTKITLPDKSVKDGFKIL